MAGALRVVMEMGNGRGMSGWVGDPLSSDSRELPTTEDQDPGCPIEQCPFVSNTVISLCSGNTYTHYNTSSDKCQ